MSHAELASSLRSGRSPRLRLRTLALSALVCGGGLSALGCEKNESMLFVVGVLALEDTDCKLVADGGATLRTGGVLDLSLRQSYTAGLLVGSQLTSRGNRDQLRTETARLSLRGAEVKLEDAGGGLIAEYTTIGTGFVDASGGTDPGFGSIAVALIPGGALTTEGLVVARVRVFGDTLGGDEIESNEYSFPIQVCRGCLVSYPAEAADMTQGPGIYLCAVRAEESTATEELVCLVGQDVGIPCTRCAAQSAVCQDPCQNCSSTASGLNCSGSPLPDCAPAP